MNKKSKIAIIGAGPAGLAIAGCLRHHQIDDFVILEAEDSLGNTWRNHYDRLHLHTVKQWSHLPFRPFPDDYPIYVPRRKVVEYLEDYAEHFQLEPVLNTRVEHITQEGDDWKIESNNGTYLAQHVVVATGVNKTPHVPSWPGMDSFEGDVIHSRDYKNPKPYKGKSVLIIGMGNTGAEVAFDLSEHDIQTHLAVRSAISLVPRDLNGQPVQVTAKRLAKIPFGIGDWLGSQIRKIYFGNLEKYGLEISKMHPAVQLRETGKTPVIDIGTIAAIKAGKIKVHRNVASIDKNSVRFEDGDTADVDSIILATGYTSDLEKLIPGIEESLDSHQLPKGIIADGKHVNMYFLGFDNYKVGGILGTIHSDSQAIANHIIDKL